RIPLEECCDLRFAVQQRNYGLDKPWILSVRAERGEPHLPIEPWLMRRTPAWRPIQVARFPFEFVRFPINSIGAPFDHNFAPIFRHHAKETVAIHNSKGLCSRINGS